MDQAEEQEEPMLSLDAKVEYDDGLSDIHKLNIAFKTMQVLGQVLRSATGTLEGDQKLQIAEACYMLGLRALRALLELGEENLTAARTYLAALIRERSAVQDEIITEREILEKTDRAVIGLNLALAFGILKKTSYAVGHPMLEETYELILSANKTNTAVNFIDLQVKLDHFAAVPIYDVTRLRDKVARNPFGYAILSNMIADFLYLYRTDVRTMQKLGNLFDIKSTAPEFLLPEFKIN